MSEVSRSTSVAPRHRRRVSSRLNPPLLRNNQLSPRSKSGASRADDLCDGLPPSPPFCMKAKLLVATCLLFLAPAIATAAEYDELPVPIKSVAPKYPSQMKQDGTSGLVLVQVLINESGDVVECIVKKSSRPEFEAPAVQAVQLWKFKPAKKAGAPVSAKLSLPVRFSAES